MDFGTDNGILEDEQNHMEIKNEIESFIFSLSDSHLFEFKSQINTLFQNFNSSFENVGLTKRHLNDVQEKIKRNIRNKNEVAKNIDDDTERYSNLKNEFENYFSKIDEKKYEETEKDKIIKQLNEEII